MSIRTRVSGLMVCLAVLLVAKGAFAAGAGQDDLDKAERAKITASTVGDLGEVIRLAEIALKKGLDQTSADFAKRLLAATRFQRARVATELIGGARTLDEFGARRQLCARRPGPVGQVGAQSARGVPVDRQVEHASRRIGEGCPRGPGQGASGSRPTIRPSACGP